MKAAVLLLLASTALAGPPGHIFPGCKGGTLEGCPGTANCTTHWIEQRIDHFNWAAPLANESHRTYSQRYFVYDKYWKPDGPVFFYLGNEDNVELCTCARCRCRCRRCCRRCFLLCCPSLHPDTPPTTTTTRLLSITQT